MMSELVIKELTPSLRDDFLLFFDNVAFADNPDWSDCYCSAYHFANRGKTESRRQASSLIEEDRIHGFLAYDDGKPVGWCNAAFRYSYPALHWLMGPGPDKSERVGAIVCFVIASTHRGKGIASQLLNAVCNKFSEKGFEFAEAYPVKNPPSDAYNFPGPLSMYLKNGFTTHRDNDWYLVVRKRLEKSPNPIRQPLKRHGPDIIGRTGLYAENYRARMAELDVEIAKLQHEMSRKQARGKPIADLEKRLEELESEKHELVERIGALWSA